MPTLRIKVERHEARNLIKFSTTVGLRSSEEIRELEQAISLIIKRMKGVLVCIVTPQVNGNNIDISVDVELNGCPNPEHLEEKIMHLMHIAFEPPA